MAACVWPCAAIAADYGVIAEQNLFDPQRRPWSKAEEPAAASPLAPEELQVEGVVLHGNVKRAIVGLSGKLRELATGGAKGRPSVILREGQAIGAYTLESIGAQQLVFLSGGKRFSIPFNRNARRDMGSAPAPLPVIQSPTLPTGAPSAAPVTKPSARTAPRPFGQPAASTSAQAPARAATPSTPPAQPAAPANPAATAPAPGGMSLLQAIQAAEAARRAGKTPSAPPFNPFAPRKN